MKNTQMFKRGFTLLELLVVVAIIGILTAVVMVALDSSRKEGDDTAVKSNLRTVANEAEIFYLDNKNSYLPFNGTTYDYAKCPSKYDPSGTDMFSKDKTIADSITEAIKRSDTNIASACYNSANAWAVAMPLNITDGTYWCVDNTGSARMITSTGESWEPLVLSGNGADRVCNK